MKLVTRTFDYGERIAVFGVFGCHRVMVTMPPRVRRLTPKNRHKARTALKAAMRRSLASRGVKRFVRH